MSERSGKLIVFEGAEGVGKTTQIGRLGQTLAALEKSGLHHGAGFEVTAPFRDVDTVDDLRVLRRHLAVSNLLDVSLSRLVAAIDEVLGNGP